jgi:hypothetical protein
VSKESELQEFMMMDSVKKLNSGLAIERLHRQIYGNNLGKSARLKIGEKLTSSPDLTTWARLQDLKSVRNSMKIWRGENDFFVANTDCTLLT